MRSKGIPGGISESAKPKRGRAKRTHIGLILTLVVLALALGTIAFSRSTSKANSSPQSKKRYVATQEIILDQATGRLRKPTVEETQAIVDQVSAFTNRSSEGLSAVSLPNGSVKVDLEGRFSGVTLGRANADGSTEIRCVMTMEEAADFLGFVEVAQDQ
ncbi:MAG TPA: hypothetical protein VFH31_20240 [Pyrinomonadaceae bacterium]|nr:hypothetical protein [Pyrinomonadaceae bacterium]